MTTDAIPLSGRASLLCTVLLLSGGGPTTSDAQPTVGAEPGALLPPIPLVDSTEQGRRTGTVRSRGRSVAGQSDASSRSFRFGRALVGSTVGVAAGTGLGLLLWRGAAEEGLGTRDDRTWGDRHPDTAAILFGAGLVAIAAGGPIGAVEGAGLEDRRTDAYVLATIGEVVLGGLGYGLVRQLGGGAGGQLAGLAAGAALGAAAGTALVASQGPRGAVSYQNGSWHVAPPDVRLRPALASNRSSSIRVTLVSVRL